MLLSDFKNAIKCASLVTVLDSQAKLIESIEENSICLRWMGTQTGTVFSGSIDQHSLDIGQKLNYNSYAVFMFWIKKGKKIYSEHPAPISFWNKLEMPI